VWPSRGVWEGTPSAGGARGFLHVLVLHTHTDTCVHILTHAGSYTNEPPTTHTPKTHIHTHAHTHTHEHTHAHIRTYVMMMIAFIITLGEIM